MSDSNYYANIPVPNSNFHCFHRGDGNVTCHKFAAMTIPAETPGHILTRMRCLDHVPSYATAKMVYMNENGHSTESEYSPVSLAEATRHVNFMSHAVAAQDTVNKVRREFNNFKESVVQTTVDWDGGCRSGKQEFLESLGLEWPSVEVTATVTFMYSGDPDELSSYDFEYALSSNIDDATDINVEFDYS